MIHKEIVDAKTENYRKRLTVLTRLTCVFLLLLSILSADVTAQPGMRLKDKLNMQASRNVIEGVYATGDDPYYSEIKHQYEEKRLKPARGHGVIIDGASASASDKNNITTDYGIGGKNENVLVWKDDYEWFEWQFDILEEGLYNIYVEYYALPGASSPVQRSLRIDGERPFLEAQSIVFPRMWTDEGKPKVNNIGDEVRPGQIEVPDWRTVPVMDSQGMYSSPFSFSFKEGRHTLRMEYINQPVAISKIRISPAQILPTYETVKKQYEDKGYKPATQEVELQAESTAILKNDPTLRSESDGDPATYPVSKGNRKLNVIGGWRWRNGGQSITWEFSTPEDGLYNIGLRLGQFWGDGLPSFRKIEIDGQVPFRELEAYSFEYQRFWRTETLSDNKGEPYSFYFTKGRHTLTMTVVLSPVTELHQAINSDALLLSKVVRQIIMLTGSNPDPNYEYELHKNIPDLLDNLKILSESMKAHIDTLTQISAKKPAIANNFALIKEQLNDMIKDPDSIPKRFNDLNNAQTSLGIWLLSLKEQPLLIDSFKVVPEGGKVEDRKSNIFQRIATTWYNFIRSFTKDYDSVSSIGSQEHVEKSLNIWISYGREWAELLKEMVDEDFTVKTGIGVNMNVLPASQLNAGAVNALMLAVASGNAPDVACGVSPVTPVEFAIRDAVVDLSWFPDYPDIENRFVPTMIEPFKYSGGIFALPETMNFMALFYREDILEELKIGIPQTWDELYNNVIPLLHQNGMQFYYPMDLSPFLLQYGGSYYNKDGTKSALDTPEAFMAFREWTELYTNYGVPMVSDFFNRMRTGEMPMGVEGYGLYIKLSVAAPELAGRWRIAPIPGHKKPDGSIDRTVAGLTGNSVIMLSQSRHQKEAWKFMRWWTSSNVQTKFGREMEALMGVEARWNTANIAAFTDLSWKKEDLEVIKGQWEWDREIPNVLGGYFTSRHISNAWNRVVLSDYNQIFGSSIYKDYSVRDSLEEAVKEINRELKSKQEEYGINN